MIPLLRRREARATPVGIVSPESLRKSPISDRRLVSKNDPRRMPMDATILEERRCRCVMLITSEAQILKEHRDSCVK